MLMCCVGHVNIALVEGYREIMYTLSLIPCS